VLKNKHLVFSSCSFYCSECPSQKYVQENHEQEATPAAACEAMGPSPKRPRSETQAANEEPVQSLPEVAMHDAERAPAENAGDEPDASQD